MGRRAAAFRITARRTQLRRPRPGAIGDLDPDDAVPGNDRDRLPGSATQHADPKERSVQQTVLVAVEEYLSMRETAEILADPAALRGLAEAREAEQAGDVVYGTEVARALLAERKR
jgi:hypothetical protein